MESISLLQGSPEWHAHRATHFNASDAPAMMSCSPYQTRTQLMHQMHTGIALEHDAATEARFKEGHRFEALARPLAEKIIGDDLYPVVGVQGKYSASFDGLDMLEVTAFEHKRINNDLRKAFDDIETIAPEYRAKEAGRHLPMHYLVQMEHQCMVSGCERILFMASNWDQNDNLIEERHCWYYPDLDLRDKIVRGWAQFDADLAAYVPADVAPAIVAQAVTALPSISVQVSGSITVNDNMAVFEVALRDFIESRLIREPKTDQDFADLDLQIKALKGAEAALDSIEVRLMSQVDAIDVAKRQKDMLHKLTRDNRLMAEKLLTAQKEKIKADIVQEGVLAFSKHIATLNQRIGHNYMPNVPTDFPGAVRNKRTIDSLRESVNNELTRAKIAANEIADRIEINLKALDKVAADYPTLFPDRAAIITKAADDLAALIQNRVNAETARLEAERARIREEEQAKAQKDAEAQVAARAAADLAIAKAAEPAPVAAPAPMAAPAPTTVVSMTRRAAPVTPSAVPTLKLGMIAERLGFNLTAAFLLTLGFKPAATDKSSQLFHEADFSLICAALVEHIQRVQADQSKQAA